MSYLRDIVIISAKFLLALKYLAEFVNITKTKKITEKKTLNEYWDPKVSLMMLCQLNFNCNFQALILTNQL